MKIAFVYDIPYPWHRGGIEHILNVEARELAKKHEVHFFTMKWPGMKKEFTYQNVRYHAFGEVTEETAYKHGRRAIREAVLFSVYMKDIFNYDFDVIISNAFPILHLPIVKLYCRMKNAKLILKVDEVWDNDYWISYLGMVAGNAANLYANTFLKSDNAKYVANSTDTARKLEAFGISKGRIKVFAPILEDREMRSIREKTTKRENRIIFAGRLIKEKRVDKWLRIVKKVVDRKNEVTAVLIGEGIEKKGIMEEIKTLGLEKKVRVRPFFKNKNELYREIAGSKVLLHMGEREGLSIITLESLALGTPVVLPEYSPIPKEVRDMCIVEDEDKIPSKIIDIMDGNGASIDNKSNLKMFSVSNVTAFYDGLFKS
jgi:glycosyltransferase involved in cell wall biosynthesis